MVTSLDQAVRSRLDSSGGRWLDATIAEVTADPAAIRMRFPAVGRKMGKGMLEPGADPDDLFAWTIDDGGRTLLLEALGPDVTDELPGLYRHGDAAERRGVLRALHYLDIGDEGMPIVDDALRTNDLRLVAAAMGPYAVARLSDEAFAQAVLKCVFVGIRLDRIAGLGQRATPDLSRMLARFAHERVAAGRSVPPDAWPVIDIHPPTDEIAAIEAELRSPVPERRTAAGEALAERDAATKSPRSI